MRFLVDAQLPPALARWLSARGHDAEHVFDRWMSEADDRVIWEHRPRLWPTHRRPPAAKTVDARPTRGACIDPPRPAR